MNYYQSKIIKNVTVNEIRPKVEEALKRIGFGILTEIDIQKTMKEKLEKDYLPHVILGACSPFYADQLLSIEPTISTLLPCNVTLRELENGHIKVAMMNPTEALKIVDNPKIEQIGQEVQEKLTSVLHSLE